MKLVQLSDLNHAFLLGLLADRQEAEKNQYYCHRIADVCNELHEAKDVPNATR